MCSIQEHFDDLWLCDFLQKHVLQNFGEDKCFGCFIGTRSNKALVNFRPCNSEPSRGVILRHMEEASMHLVDDTTDKIWMRSALHTHFRMSSSLSPLISLFCGSISPFILRNTTSCLSILQLQLNSCCNYKLQLLQLLHLNPANEEVKGAEMPPKAIGSRWHLHGGPAIRCFLIITSQRHRMHRAHVHQSKLAKAPTHHFTTSSNSNPQGQDN